MVSERHLPHKIVNLSFTITEGRSLLLLDYMFFERVVHVRIDPITPVKTDDCLITTASIPPGVTLWWNTCRKLGHAASPCGKLGHAAGRSLLLLDYMFFERDTDGFSFEDGGTPSPPTIHPKP